MPRAQHIRKPDAEPDTARPAAPAPPAPPERVLWLQRAAGNRAVTAQLARQPALTGLPDKAPAAAPPPVAGPARVLAGPPPTRDVEAGEGPRPGAELGADAESVTLTFLIRDLHLKGRDPATIDWLHEPGVEVEATPGRVPKPVLSAAVDALNHHLRVHGKEIAEVALGAKAGVDHEGTPSATAELSAQVALSATFSITAGTSVTAGPRREAGPEDGVPLTRPGAPVSLDWSPLSVGVQFTLGAPEPEQRAGPGDYAADMADGRAGAWVAGQLAAAELGPLDATTLVDDLLGALRAARGDEAQFAMRVGVLPEHELPPGLSRTLARAAQLLVRAKPSLRRLRAVRVTVLRSDEAEHRERAVRWFVVPLGSVTVSAPPPAAPPQRTWGAP